MDPRANGFVHLRGLRLTTQPVPSKDESGMDPYQCCDDVQLCGEASQQALKELHVVLYFYEFYCDGVEAYTDLEAAKARFREREERIWSSIEECRNPEFGLYCGLMKLNKYHCDWIECAASHRIDPSSPSAWHGPDKGNAAWLVTLVIGGPAIDLDEKGDWPPANLEVRHHG